MSQFCPTAPHPFAVMSKTGHGAVTRPCQTWVRWKDRLTCSAASCC